MGTTDSKPRLTPELVRALQGAAMKDDADVGMPVDDSQVATRPWLSLAPNPQS